MWVNALSRIHSGIGPAQLLSHFGPVYTTARRSGSDGLAARAKPAQLVSSRPGACGVPQLEAPGEAEDTHEG